jgi:hypothetical protein
MEESTIIGGNDKAVVPLHHLSPTAINHCIDEEEEEEKEDVEDAMSSSSPLLLLSPTVIKYIIHEDKDKEDADGEEDSMPLLSPAIKHALDDASDDIDSGNSVHSDSDDSDDDSDDGEYNSELDRSSQYFSFPQQQPYSLSSYTSCSSSPLPWSMNTESQSLGRTIKYLFDLVGVTTATTTTTTAAPAATPNKSSPPPPLLSRATDISHAYQF